MLVNLEMQDLAVLLAEVQSAQRRSHELADLTDDPVAAENWRAAAGRYGRIADELGDAAYRWHSLDMAERPRRKRRTPVATTA